MLAVADGSDMMGSLRNPAAWNNVWSLRPTWGLVPGEPSGDTFLHPLSTAGPMARSPRDLAALLATLAAPDPRVPFARPLPDLSLDGPPERLRIGWLADWGGAYPMETGVLDLCAAALGRLEALGCSVVPLAPPMPGEALWESWTTLRAFAVAGSLAAPYADPAARARMKPEALGEVARGLALSAREVQAASEVRSAWFARAAELFEEVDAVALPAAQCWPFPADWRWPGEIAGVGMDSYHRWMEVTVPASLAGLPALGMPAGFGADGTPWAGLPMGLQIVGPPGADGRLLRLAHLYEAETRWPARRPPPPPGAGAGA
jgi:amidase